ncbi:NUDIX domain-containing protein [Nonomuraea sp. NPDC002799]
MGLDLSLVPDVVKPVAPALTGGALPEADDGGLIAEAQVMEELADLLAEIRTDDAGAVMRLLRDGAWQGAAKKTFEGVFAALSGREDATGSPEALLDLLEQVLRDEARSLRDHGVRMQHTEWMIYASLALLGAMIVRLLVWIYVNGPAVLRLIHHHTLMTQVNVQTLKKLVLLNMLRFGGIMGGLDFGVQRAQQIWGDREAGDFDVASLAMSAGSGALTGVLFAGANAGLSRLLSRPMVYVASKAELAIRDRIVALGQSMYGQALLGGVAATAGATPGLALSGQLDASHLAYTFVSGVTGGLDIPAAARVSYIPMLAVADLGGRPAGAGAPFATGDPPPGAGLPVARQHQPPASPDNPAGGRHDGPSAERHDLATLAQHAPPERHGGSDTVPDRPRPSEADGGTLPPPRGETIAGEVVRRRDTLLPATADGSARHDGASARQAPHPPAERPPSSPAIPAERPASSPAIPAERTPPHNVAPAERTPASGTATMRTDATAPGALPRSSMLPATVPAANTIPHITEAGEQDRTGRDPAGGAPDAAPRPAPHQQANQDTPPLTDQQTSTLTRTSQDRTEPPAPPGTPVITARTGHGDRSADAVLPGALPRNDLPRNDLPRNDPALPARPPSSTAGAHPPAQGEHPPAVSRAEQQHLPESPTTPDARSRALPADLRMLESPPERVANLLSRDGAYDPISVHAWDASDKAAVERLMDTMSSATKDILGAGGEHQLRDALGDPGHLLVHVEYHAMDRTIRSWRAIEQSTLPSFSEGNEITGPRHVLLQMPFDSPGALQMARRLGVQRLFRMWGFGAGELLPPRLAMNMAAVDEFGLKGVVDLGTFGGPSRGATARRDYGSSGEVLRDFLRQQYAATQRELARHGIEELTLYRGVGFEWGHEMPSLAAAATGDVVAAPPGLPLQAWSALPGVAKRYTGVADGAVMAGVFPASRVLATPWTGIGQLPLHEFVLLAGPGEVTVLRPPHVGEPDPSYADLPRGWRIRTSGEDWTQCDQGHRHWGTEGAAGLLPFHRGPGGEVRVLMQLRSPDTHHGGLWGPVAGARHHGEQPVETAFREAGEEMRLDLSQVRVRATHHDDHGGWAFDTVIGEMPSFADVWPASPESIDVAWIPLPEVRQLALHPDFAASWPEVHERLDRVLADDGTGSTRPAGGSALAADGPGLAAAGPARPAGAAHHVPQPPVPHPWNSALSDGFSPIADPRPRNFAEAAAIVHRWTPGDGAGRDHGVPGKDDAPPNRIKQLLNHDDGGPPNRGLVERGRRLMQELPVNDRNDATAAALATISMCLGPENPRKAIGDLAMRLFGDRMEVGALVELHQAAERQGRSPETARDRHELTDILARSMGEDRHRWLGHQHRSLLPFSTAAEARAAGLLVEMMGSPASQDKISDFTRPLLSSSGPYNVRQMLPLVHAAHANGYLPPGTSGSDAFHQAMQRFRQNDPALWKGLLVADRYLLAEIGEQGARRLSALNDIVTHPDTGMGRRVYLPLERLAGEVGQGRSVEQLLRLAEDAQTHGADPTRAGSHRELLDLLTTHRAREQYLWDGLRLATEHGVARASDAEARALARLTEVTGSGPASELWVFHPLRRLADEAGLGHSVERLAQRAAEAGQTGFDLFGPVDRRQVLDALKLPRLVNGRPDPRGNAPGLHDLAPSAVREARETASQEHARARKEDRRAHPHLPPITGQDPLQVARQERLASLESRAEAWQRWPELSEVSFTRDFASFRRTYDQAVERGLRGEAVLPYLYENVTGSLAARDGGRGFGLEIEYDVAEGAGFDTLMGIPRALYEAGLTAGPDVHKYHATKEAGYQTGEHGGRGLWRLEADSSVVGELVSPILYDEPETWENLRLACEIIRSNGGTASVRTGGHIHVSTHDYDHIVANYISVLNHVSHHTDTLYRLGHNPARESHRGQEWCRPSPLPSTGYESIGQVRGLHGRTAALNTFGVEGKPTDHVEFRMWDGSLDPAVIQARVNLSLALVEASFRNATLDALPNGGRHDTLGTHIGLRPLGSQLDTTEEGSLSFRLLMDEIFWRAADKEQLTALYAVTRWADALQEHTNEHDAGP